MTSQTVATGLGTRTFLVLLLGSIGVVYGDIGTSPLYAFREALRPFSADGIFLIDGKKGW